jgi:hypothetical protein
MEMLVVHLKRLRQPAAHGAGAGRGSGIRIRQHRPGAPIFSDSGYGDPGFP